MPWSDMAVVVRGQGRTATMRRVLVAAGVPVAGTATDLPVRDEVAVRPLLALLEVVLDLARAPSDVLDAALAVDRSCHRSVAPTRSGCGGCGARCAGTSSTPVVGARATSCSPRSCIAPGGLIELGP